MVSSFAMLAAYNRWANRRLYAAAGRLSDADYRADRGAFFRSVCGTLNHLLVTDCIWMQRFTGAGDAPDRLDAILFEDFGDLSAARETEDARIVAYVGSLAESDLAGAIQYRRVSTPEKIMQPLGPGLLHLFNHQTHHRGQVHCLLTGLSSEAPALDLLFYQREAAAGRA